MYIFACDTEFLQSQSVQHRVRVGVTRLKVVRRNRSTQIGLLVVFPAKVEDRLIVLCIPRSGIANDVQILVMVASSCLLEQYNRHGLPR